MELKEFVQMNAAEVIEIEFEESGFHVKVRPLSREVFNDIAAKSTTYRFDRRTRQKVAEIDERKRDRFLDEATIVDWRGLTTKVVNRLIPTMQGSEGVEMDHEFPCTPESKRFLMDRSLDFATWVNDCLLDAGSILAAKEEAEAKNSSTSPDGTRAAGDSPVTSV